MTTRPILRSPTPARLGPLVLFALLLAGPAAAGPVQRGVALGLFASDPGWDYGPLLDEIQALGATHVLLTVVWTQRTLTSARIHREPGISPRDDVVLATLRQARQRGLEATLMPIVRLEQRSRGEWRGRIAPAAGAQAWFSSYRDYIATMARIAQQGGAARLYVGSELISLEGHEALWRGLIGEVRGLFSGKLGYSANWDLYREVPFWDAVDEVGVTAYFELASDDGPLTDADLAHAWQTPRAALAAWKAKRRRPLVITEVGYPSLVGAARWPWDETRQAPVDLALQAQLIEAFCAAFRRRGVIDGFYVWNWFGFGGPTDSSYTPRGKPAAAVVERCLRASW